MGGGERTVLIPEPGGRSMLRPYISYMAAAVLEAAVSSSTSSIR